MDEEVDFGDDESEEEVEAEECGGDGSSDPPTGFAAVADCAAAPAASSREEVESSKPHVPGMEVIIMEEKEAASNSADRAAAWRQDLEDLDEAEPIAFSFRNGGSSSSTAAVADDGKNCIHPEDVPQRVVAEQLRETARPLAPGMQRLESGAAPPQPESEWKPPWNLGQAPWQKGRDSNKSGRPKMPQHSSTWEPWLLQQRLHKQNHMPAPVPKNGASHSQVQGAPWSVAGHAGAGYGSRRPPFEYAPKMTARPPPPALSRAGPYGFRTGPVPAPQEESLSGRRVATSSSSPATVPHKAAPKSMKIKLAKAKGVQVDQQKSAPPVAEPVPWAPPLHEEPIAVATPSPSPSPSRSRSRSPVPKTSRTRPPATEVCHEVSLSSDEEDEEEDNRDDRQNGPAASQRENSASACLNEVALESDAAASADDDAEGGGADEAAEEDDAVNAAEAVEAAVEADVSEAADAPEASEADLQEEAELHEAETGVIEDFEMAEVEEVEACEMEDDLVDMSGVDNAAYEGEEANEAMEVEEAEAVEATEAVNEDELVEIAEADAVEVAEPDTADADAAEAAASELDMYPNSWLVAEGALEPVPELHEGEVDAEVCAEHMVQEEAVVTEEVALRDLIGDEVEEEVHFEVGIEEAVMGEEEEEQDNGQEEQQEQEEDEDEDGMDAEAEALLRAEAQRAENSTVTIIDDDDEDFFVDVAGGDVQNEEAASPMLRQDAGNTSAVQVPGGERRGPQVEPKKKPSAPWTRARLPNFRGVHSR